MTVNVVITVRRPRGKGVRSRKAKRRKALLGLLRPAPIVIPPDRGAPW